MTLTQSLENQIAKLTAQNGLDWDYCRKLTPKDFGWESKDET